MNGNVNYITNLPDFITMQRNSFCWFVTYGLTDELSLFSQIHDFSQNTEYFLFGEEYKLMKPPCSIGIATKYNGNYRVQLSVPIEVRNKKINVIRYSKKLSIITLPLMSSSSTFVLNGCERLIVSQIIRSPGVYFELNKNQKKQRQFKRKLSTEISKLRAFLPSGEAFMSESYLFFPFPIVKPYKTKTGYKIKNIPNWNRSNLVSYSINFLKQKERAINLNFLKTFKLYKRIVQTSKNKNKIKMIKLFIKWLKLKKSLSSFNKSAEEIEVSYLVNYFNLLLKFLIQYSIVKLSCGKRIEPDNFFPFFEKLQDGALLEKNFKKILKNLNKNGKNKNLLTIYSKVLINFQIIGQIQLNSELILTLRQSQTNLNQQDNFQFLKKTAHQLNNQIRQTLLSRNLNDIKPVIYFSKTLKDQLRYTFISRLFRKGNLLSTTKLDLPESHKYLKSKTRILILNEDHEIKTHYNKKYDEKDLYTVTVVPDYGSWIRFGFQKNTKINQYKYPLKHQEEDITVQLDKINQKPILFLLKEMGLSDFEIYRNLEHADFFYFNRPLLVNSISFNQPLLRFNLNSNYLKNISEFSRIFDPKYYRLGRIGRVQINKRLNLQISETVESLTYDDIFAIVDKLLTLTISKTIPDDIDHLKNRRVRSIGELLQNLVKIGFQRLIRKVTNQTNKIDSTDLINFQIINATVKEFFGSSQLSQYLDQTNPLASLTHRRRISGLGPGGFDRDRISFAVRDIHPSHYGRICPIETPEGQNVGLISSLTTCARINKLGFLETPFWRVINGKVLINGIPIYLTAEIEDLYRIAPADISINEDNYLTKNSISVRYNQDFINVEPSNVDFISISPVQIVSVAASLIPFFEHDDANRALMGSNMQRQSVPLLLPQKPIVGTGLENQIGIDCRMAIVSKTSGIVKSVTGDRIVVKNLLGQRVNYKLQKYLRSNQQTCINQRPIIWEGEKIGAGQLLTDGPSISASELALGQNVLVAYMPWQGYNFEDAILLNERLVYDDIFTSIHIEKYKIEIDRSLDSAEETTKNIPNLNLSEIRNLNEDGIVKIGTFIKPGDILVGKVLLNDTSEQLPESKLLRAIFGAKAKGVKDNSYRMPDGQYGRVIETVSFNRRTRFTYKFEKIYIFIAQIRKIQVGDKIAGRHGNKGIISRILPRQDMPFLPDGTPIDIILNPLGVPSRMNVGQLYECLLGLAGDKLNCRFKILPFDEMYGLEMSRILINKKLRQASIVNDEAWLFNPYAPGKMVLIDGRTGQEFENPITVGKAYMLKLIHLVEDKIHARATGPYSLITQQPLRGKAQHGGQRFGEMEVWALEGFGAAFTLKELLTIKSDDMEGRNETLNAIVKGQKIPKFGIPESFKVLIQELRSIGLDMSTYRIENFSSYTDYEVEAHLIEKYDASSKTFSPTSNTNTNEIEF
jgi:DNA-directed RNA polymerase subunit beta